MQESCHAVGAPDQPRLRQEALVEVRLLAREQRVILRRAQEALRSLGLLHLGEPDVPHTVARRRRPGRSARRRVSRRVARRGWVPRDGPPEGSRVRSVVPSSRSAFIAGCWRRRFRGCVPREQLPSQGRDLRRRLLAQHQQRVVVAEYCAFLPVDPDPRWIPQHEIEATPDRPVRPLTVEHVRERQFPMMEAVPPGQLVHEPQPRELVEHLLHVEHADLVGDTPGDVGGVLRVLGAEQVGGLSWADARLVDRAGQHERDLVEDSSRSGSLSASRMGQNHSAHQ